MINMGTGAMAAPAISHTENNRSPSVFRGMLLGLAFTIFSLAV